MDELRMMMVSPVPPSSISSCSYLAQSLDSDCMLPEIPEYTLTEEDIANYLVDDGLTLEELVSYEENY